MSLDDFHGLEKICKFIRENLKRRNAMKKLLFVLGMLSMFAFTACDDSASSGDSSDNGSGSKTSSTPKGSFPANGDEGFYCEVTSGDGWAQIKVNIPGYKGHVEKRSYDAVTETATQYYEEV